MIAWIAGLIMARWAVSAAVANLLAVLILFGTGAAAYGTWHYAVYSSGYNAADAAWREKNLEAQIEKLKRELEAQKEVDKFEDEEAKNIEAERDRLKKENEAYEEELKKRGDSCPLTDDDINRLRER